MRRRSLCPILTLLSYIYSVLGQLREQREHRRNGPGANQEAPYGGSSLAATTSVRLTCAVGRPLVGLSGGVLSCGGRQVALKSVPGVHGVWRRFGHVCGPWDLGMHTCRLLIRPTSLPWICDISEPWCLA
jgi:hypothetical protein